MHRARARAQLGLLHDEVRFLIFDDPAELYGRRSRNVPDLDPGRVNCQTRARAPRARDA